MATPQSKKLQAEARLMSGRGRYTDILRFHDDLDLGIKSSISKKRHVDGSERDIKNYFQTLTASGVEEDGGTLSGYLKNLHNRIGDFYEYCSTALSLIILYAPERHRRYKLMSFKSTRKEISVLIEATLNLPDGEQKDSLLGMIKVLIQHYKLTTFDIAILMDEVQIHPDSIEPLSEHQLATLESFSKVKNREDAGMDIMLWEYLVKVGKGTSDFVSRLVEEIKFQCYILKINLA